MTDIHGIDKIFDMVMAFNGETRYERLLDSILEKMMQLTNSDAGTLYVLEDDTLHFWNIKNNSLNIFLAEDDEINLPPIPLNQSNIENISAYVALNNEVVVIDDVYEDSRFNFAGPKNYDKITGYRTRSMLVLPLATYRNERPEILGVIQLLNTIDPKTGKPGIYRNIFQPPVIPALANIAANTLGNFIHLNEIRMLFHSFAAAMARTIDERSCYNSNHTLNVTGYAETFAAYLGETYPHGDRLHFDARRSEELAMAAILHDIGKIITPIEIMDKSDKLGAKLTVVRYRFQIKKLQLEGRRQEYSPAEFDGLLQDLENARNLVEETVMPAVISDEKLTEIKNLSRLTYLDFDGKEVPLLDEEDIDALCIRFGTLTTVEREIMQQHAVLTGRILENAAFTKYYKNVLEWSRSHHEFMNGSGYPDGKTAADLSVETRILTILDIYEALTASDRPYKKAIPPDKAFDILRSMADEGKLDGELIDIFEQSDVWRNCTKPKHRRGGGGAK